MTPELTMLAWTLVLALFQILLTANMRTRETGLSYNASPRDAPAPPPGILTARVMRAQQNLLETLPIFIAAVVIVEAADLHSAETLWGARLYLIGRVCYLPLYAFGIPYVRSLAWLVSMAGILMLLVPALIS